MFLKTKVLLRAVFLILFLSALAWIAADGGKKVQHQKEHTGTQNGADCVGHPVERRTVSAGGEALVYFVDYAVGAYDCHREPQ